MQFTLLTPTLWVAQSRIYAMNVGVWLHGGGACLVDPGVMPDEIAQIEVFLAEQHVAPRYVVLTHSHYDHLLGARAFPEAEVFAQAHYLAEVERDGPAIRHILVREGIVAAESPFEIPLPDRTFADTTTLEFDGLTLHLVHAPGHAADELVLYEPREATLWAGDMLSDVEIPYVSDALAPYERTLELLAGYEVRVLVPGHGRPTDDPAEAQRRLANDRQYLAALRAGVTTAMAEGLTLEQTVARCAGQPLAYPGNEGMHRLNVESAYAELGGPADLSEVGWGRAWKEMLA
jgi:hydroxyacylglutathione hydrolase